MARWLLKVSFHSRIVRERSRQDFRGITESYRVTWRCSPAVKGSVMVGNGPSPQDLWVLDYADESVNTQCCIISQSHQRLGRHPSWHATPSCSRGASANRPSTTPTAPRRSASPRSKRCAGPTASSAPVVGTARDIDCPLVRATTSAPRAVIRSRSPPRRSSIAPSCRCGCGSSGSTTSPSPRTASARSSSRAGSGCSTTARGS